MNEKRDHTIDILQDALKTAYSVPHSSLPNYFDDNFIGSSHSQSGTNNS